MSDGTERTVERGDLPSLPLAQVEELRLSDPPQPNRWRLGFMVQTAGGDALRTERLRLHDDRLAIDSPLVGLADLPLSAVSLVWFLPPSTLPAAARSDVEQTATRASGRDTLFIRKAGEWVKLEGVLQSLDERRIIFKWQETEREIPAAIAAVLVLAGAQSATMPREQLAAATGRDGSRLVGIPRVWTADSITLASASLGDVVVPLDGVAACDLLWGRSVFVGDLQPAAVKEAGFFGTPFPWRRDAGVSGTPLTIHRRVFEHGLGVHARSSLTYRLDRKFALLSGSIGLDDAGGGRGRVVFVVRGDGKELMRTPMTAAEAPRPWRVSVTGVDKLELLADFSGQGDDGAHADWAELRLVK